MYIDSHCHLNFKAFEKDLDQVIQEAIDSNIKAIVNVGAKLDSSQKAVEIAQKYKYLYASVGIHPHHADKLEENWLKNLEQLAIQDKVIAIGECGLDYNYYRSNGIVDPKNQKEIFEKQILLAYRLKLPLEVHNRFAEKDLYEIISANKNHLQNPPGMIHCFSGSQEFLKKILNLGFYIGFDGNITYQGIAKGETTDLKDLVKYAPINRILTETDSPYLSPGPYRGTRNVPKNVIIVAEYIAELKKLPIKDLEDQIYNNFKTVFKKVEI
ncbi:TatD family deoxyribonuclease [Candidatus Parcubacteria bacterium]|nr:MAG: TatD family deoxyribonuclease [Candidatus Parcubacteria bacterium]